MKRILLWFFVLWLFIVLFAKVANVYAGPFFNPIPKQKGHSGEYLTTNGKKLNFESVAPGTGADAGASYLTRDAEAGLTDEEVVTANGLAIVQAANYAAMKVLLDLEIGTDIQAWDAFLDDIAALTDPGRDRIVFWDDTSGNIVWLDVGTGLDITGTTLTATGGSGTGDLLADGTVPLTANWDVGPYTVTALRFISDIAIGTSPFAVTSTTVVSNLNADLLDGTELSALTTDAELAAWVGSANITTLGTIGTGTWEGDDIVTGKLENYGSWTMEALGATLTLSDGDIIDFSGITHSEGVDEGIVLPAYVNVAPATVAKHFMAYDPANNAIMVRETGGWVDTSAGTGAATSLNFVVTAAEGSLSDESVLTAGYGIDVTDAGGDGGAVTVAVDTTEISADGTDTWSDGSNASIVWTFDVSGTDHSMTAGNGLMTFGDAVTVTDTLTALSGIDMGTSQTISGTTAMTLGGGSETIAINSSDWDISSTGVMTGIGAITSNGVVTSTGLTIGSAAIIEAELEIIDGATLNTSDINIIDGISDSGNLTAGELLYVDGVTSAIQAQLNAKEGTLTNEAGLYSALSDVTLFLEDLVDDTTPSLGGDLAIAAYELQSTSNIVLQLGDAAGANVFEIEDSDGTTIFDADSDGNVYLAGSISSEAVNNPYYKFDENDGTDYWMGIYDTTTDRLEFRRSITVDTSVDMYLDANELQVNGNVDVSSGHTFQINGTQIALTNLSDGLSHNAGHERAGADEIDGDHLGIDFTPSNYTPATTPAEAANVDDLAAHLQGIDTVLGASGTGTLAGMTDTTISSPAAGHLLIWDGSDSWDNKAVSGDITIDSAGVVTLAANAVDSDNYVDGSIDVEHLSANSVDSDAYVDASIDLAHMSAESVDSDQYVDGSIDNEHLAGSIDVSKTALAAGRSLTLSTNTMNADAELYTDSKCIYIEDPTADDDLESIWRTKDIAVTLTSIWAESDQTVNFDLQIDDGSPADVNGSDISPAAGEAEDTDLGGDTAMADGDRLDLVVTSVSGDPTWVSICWTYTKDD